MVKRQIQIMPTISCASVGKNASTEVMNNLLPWRRNGAGGAGERQRSEGIRRQKHRWGTCNQTQDTCAYHIDKLEEPDVVIERGVEQAELQTHSRLRQPLPVAVEQVEEEGRHADWVDQNHNDGERQEAVPLVVEAPQRKVRQQVRFSLDLPADEHGQHGARHIREDEEECEEDKLPELAAGQLPRKTHCLRVRHRPEDLPVSGQQVAEGEHTQPHHRTHGYNDELGVEVEQRGAADRVPRHEVQVDKAEPAEESGECAWPLDVEYKRHVRCNL